MDNNSHKSSISARSVAPHLWEDDQEWLTKFCQETGRDACRVVRELFSEALHMRCAATSPDSRADESENAIIETIGKLSGRLNHPDETMGEHYGLLLEILIAFDQTRSLIWEQSGRLPAHRNGDLPERTGITKERKSL